ncbi:Rrf2 family transcriptional regulator [Lacinutrix neustonica]|uniref:Rrf2 family transcriptional regulator n=1 Tax=Lacinutrix neustonica TaxID=2980107 RepID=A0A9E8MXZ9_9FLAO|nr:Rrf2 family transcriptional regulator [Lacinutrix neustonica]WAC02339.1 Rrf2 family transcriptional regulator [Lacinutrix neustonica]
MFSKSVKYALKAVLFLAVNSNDKKKVMVKDLAKPINVPQAYIAKVLQELSKQKIISSTRGPKGGVFLDEKNREQSLVSIIYAIEGEKKMTHCLLNLKKCNLAKPCPLHHLANPSREELIKTLKNKTINDLAMDIKSGRSFLPI